MDEKIEEILRDVCRYANSKMCVDGTCPHLWECPLDHRTIKALVRKGYRRESNTAREILTEFLDFVNGWFEGVENNDFGVEFNRILKDLAEKYGVDLGE